MPTSYTSLIGLALPVTGELSGTWGDVVNNYITNYLDSAVAGTQTISGSQTAVTLSVTNGSSLVTAGSGATGSAQFQIINCTGNPAGLLTITAPASSRQYIIINATSTSQSVKIVGTGPTTGVTLIAGEKAHVAWNGSDFVKIATTAAAGGSNTQVQYNSSGVLAGSSNLTFDGTTLTANALTITNNPTLNGGTANGVLYLNGSKVASSGSALTFDGTNFATTGTATATRFIPSGSTVATNGLYLPAANSIGISTNSTNAIYIDSSQNVGVGVTPSAWDSSILTALQVRSGSISSVPGGGNDTYFASNAYYNVSWKYIAAASAPATYYRQANGVHSWHSAASGTAGNAISFTQAMTLDSSGNLGIGTTSPGAKVHAYDTSNSKLLSQTTTGYAQFQASSTSGDFHIVIDNSTGAGFGAGAYSRLLYSTGAYPMVFSTNATERARITSGGNVCIGTTSALGGAGLTVSGGGGYITLNSTTVGYTTIEGWDSGTTKRWRIGQIAFGGADGMAFYTGASDTERARITSGGDLLVGKTTTDITAAGVVLLAGGDAYFSANGPLQYLNRTASDGDLVQFRQANTTEGTISVSGTTVSYNGGHLSRWSQLPDNSKDDSILKGTVMSNLDAMCEWVKDGQPLPNEQLNRMKVSDVEGDTNVAGVFVNWTRDEDCNTDDMNVAMTGDMIIRIAQGVTVQRGDLLMSAGDGTAKPQGDDIVRSKTVAKVTSTHVTCTYADGSYCVPCVLIAC